MLPSVLTLRPKRSISSPSSTKTTGESANCGGARHPHPGASARARSTVPARGLKLAYDWPVPCRSNQPPRPIYHVAIPFDGQHIVPHCPCRLVSTCDRPPTQKWADGQPQTKVMTARWFLSSCPIALVNATVIAGNRAKSGSRGHRVQHRYLQPPGAYHQITHKRRMCCFSERTQERGLIKSGPISPDPQLR